MHELRKGKTLIDSVRVALGSKTLVETHLESLIDDSYTRINFVDSTMYKGSDTNYYLITDYHKNHPLLKRYAQQMENYIYDIYRAQLGDTLQISESQIYIELKVPEGDFKIRHKIDYTDVLDMSEQERYHLVDFILAKAFMSRYAQ